MRKWPALLLAFLSIPAAADVLHLKDGRKFEGEVLSETDGRIRLRVQGMVTTFDLEKVDRIERGEPWANDLLIARSEIRGGQIARALESILLASDRGASMEDASRVIVEGAAALRDGAAVARGADASAILTPAGALTRKTDALSPAARFVVAQVLIAIGQQDRAAAALSTLGQDFFAEGSEEQRFLRRHFRDELRRLAARGDFALALSRIEVLQQLDPTGGEAQRPLLHLAQSSQARDAGDYATAFRILCEELAPVLPETARNRTRLAAAELLRKAPEDGSFAEARRALEHADRCFPIEARNATMSLYEVEGRWLLDRNRAEDAWRLLGTIPPGQRSDVVSELLVDADYLRRRAQISEEDPLAVFELGKWCAEHGLLEEAITIFRRTRDNTSLRDVSDRQLSIMLQERDTILLQRAVDAADIGDFSTAEELLVAILDNPGRRSHVAAEAERLRTVVRRDMGSEERRRPYLAEVFFQRAERHYFVGELDESLEILEMILRQHENTPAAERARGLLPDVLRQMELALIEGRRQTLPMTGFAVEASRLREAENLERELDQLMGVLDASRLITPGGAGDKTPPAATAAPPTAGSAPPAPAVIP